METALKNKYELTFLVIKTDGYPDTYTCRGDMSINGSMRLASLLQTISNYEYDSLLEEVNAALIGNNVEDLYVFDSAYHIWIEFTNPTARIVFDDDQFFEVPLEELKQLLLEWEEFVTN